MKMLLIVTLCLLTGCSSVSRQFYSSSGTIRPLSSNGFTVEAPKSWGLFFEIDFDNGQRKKGLGTAIMRYTWSPVVQFDKLSDSVHWQDDLTRMEAELVSRAELKDIKPSESLTHYNKLSGHGLRKVGTSGGRRWEMILFYPVGELGGCRLLVILAGSPNADSLREMGEVIRSVRFVPSVEKK
jgi:hypothetical protein